MRCARCYAPLTIESDRYTLALVVGVPVGRAWRQEGPWPVVRLCGRCFRRVTDLLADPPMRLLRPVIEPVRIRVDDPPPRRRRRRRSRPWKSIS
jgi:hypothetical protein